jgi:hypothetical protein
MVGDAHVCRTSSVLERCSPLSLLRDRATEESEMNNFERDEAIDLDFKNNGASKRLRCKDRFRSPPSIYDGRGQATDDFMNFS